MARHEGLSPRVRGNHERVPNEGLLPRSIPACAGEPCWLSWRPQRARVYPRVCGGTPFEKRRNFVDKGLSPRVRGNLVHFYQKPIGKRSIPACAGEPIASAHLYVVDRVYPRVCGGTISARCSGDSRRGLSPRVRGNLQLFCRPAEKIRSIPACAGEPVIHTVKQANGAVYPRVCGGTASAFRAARLF